MTPTEFAGCSSRSSSLSGYISSSSIHSWDSVLSDESHMVLRHHNHAVYPAAETEPEGLGSRDAGGCAFVESFNRNFNGNDKAVHVNGTHCGYGNVVGGVCGASSNWGQKQDRWLYVKSALSKWSCKRLSRLVSLPATGLLFFIPAGHRLPFLYYTPS